VGPLFLRGFPLLVVGPLITLDRVEAVSERIALGSGVKTARHTGAPEGTIKLG
jgi:hypothetical protein